MEQRRLGTSGLHVPVLCMGTATFGGTGNFAAWGTTDRSEARTIVDRCMDHELNFFDTADIYSRGLSEEILGSAIEGRRQHILISTKATFPMGTGPNDRGSSRHHILRACEASLRRLQTDYIDVYHMHGFDANTPVEETLRALDDLVESGKVRYLACSNFSGWHLMKSLAVSERYGWHRYVAHQIYYSLVNREAEWELMPLGADQGVGSLVWSPLAGGRLGGRYGRTRPEPSEGRVAKGSSPVPQAAIPMETFYAITDELEALASETGKTMAQIALNWLLRRPTVSSIVIGARNEEQLLANLGAVGWALTEEQTQRLDRASSIPMIYPYWHQQQIPSLTKPLQSSTS